MHFVWKKRYFLFIFLKSYSAKLTYLHRLAVASLKHQYLIPFRHGLCFRYGLGGFGVGLIKIVDDDVDVIAPGFVCFLLNHIYFMQCLVFYIVCYIRWIFKKNYFNVFFLNLTWHLFALLLLAHHSCFPQLHLLGPKYKITYLLIIKYSFF